MIHSAIKQLNGIYLVMGIKERKDRERERRRQQILVAAKRVFSEKGFHKATMEDIAREAELSPGTLYLYFKNKDELFSSLSLRILQYLQLRLEHIANSEDNLTSEQKVQALKEALYDVYEFDSLMLINLFHLQSSETLRNLSPTLLSDMNELSRNSLSMMAKIFNDGISEGDFIEKHPIALADIVWGLFSGLVLWEESKKVIDGDKNYLQDTLEIAFDIIKRGICKKTNIQKKGEK
jgi:AcrR family transcriptional regulator